MNNKSKVITKADIGMPENFRHFSHGFWDWDTNSLFTQESSVLSPASDAPALPVQRPRAAPRSALRLRRPVEPAPPPPVLPRKCAPPHVAYTNTEHWMAPPQPPAYTPRRGHATDEAVTLQPPAYTPHYTQASISNQPIHLSEELYKLVADGKYDDAVELIKNLDKAVLHGLLNETIKKLLDSHSTAKTKLMSFAYKLWNSEAQDVVKTHFPVPFKLIFDELDLKIVNKGYQQALKLDANMYRSKERLACGDTKDKTSRRVSWQLIPVWENNEVTFKLYNVDCNMYLKLDVNKLDDGHRAVWGSTHSNTERHRYYLEPRMEDEDLVFFIINYKYGQGLKLAAAADDTGDRALVEHNGDIYRDKARFRWIISAW